MNDRSRVLPRGPEDSGVTCGVWRNVETRNRLRKSPIVWARTEPESRMAGFSTAPERDTREPAWGKAATALQVENWIGTTIRLTGAKSSVGKRISMALKSKRKVLPGCGSCGW